MALLEWVESKGALIDQSVMDAAVASGRVETMQYLWCKDTWRCEDRWIDQMCTYAGTEESVRWVCEHFHCVISAVAMERLARKGQLAALQYAVNHVNTPI